MRVEIMGKCGKIGGAEVCLSMFDLYEYFIYLELDLGSPNLDPRSLKR
jgi:hypothetical protein